MNKKIVLLHLLLSISFHGYSNELDLLINPQQIDPNALLRRERGCVQCASSQKQDNKCPVLLESLIDQTMNRSLYSMLVGNKLLNLCSTFVKSSSTHMKNDQNLARELKHQFKVNVSDIEACLQQNGIDFKASPNTSKDSAKKSIMGYLHLMHKSILDNQLESIKELASIDRLLGKSPLLDIKCNENYQSSCDIIRNCNSSSESLDEVADLSLIGLQEVVELEAQFVELSIKKQSKLTRTQVDEAKKDIKEKIEYVYSMIPWVKGDELNSELRTIKEKIAKDNHDAARKIFQESYRKQLTKGRELLREKYLKSLVDLSCVEDNRGCSFDSLAELNSYIKAVPEIKNEYQSKTKLTSKELNSSIEKIEVQNLLNSGYCVSKLLKDKKETDEDAELVASVGVGLVTGGLGGVRALGLSALKFYQAGNRLKGVSALGLLGAEGDVVYQTTKNTAENCKNSLSGLNNHNLETQPLCSEKGKEEFRVSDLKSCIVDIALTTVPAALSLRGSSRVGRTSSEIGGEAKLSLEARKAMIVNGIKNTKISGEDKKDLIESLLKLDLDDAELGKIIKKLNESIVTDVDKNRMKNYINYVLSLGKSHRKKALDQLHEVALLSGSYNPGGYVQKFYAKEAKFYHYEKVKRDTLKKEFLKNGKSESEALKEAEKIARASRYKLQSKYYSCQSKSVTPEHKAAAKKYLSFSMALGIGGTTYGYTKANADKIEENPQVWFGKLGYDIGMTYLLTRLSAEIIKSPSGTISSRYVQANLGSGAIGTIDAAIYSNLYGGSEDEARKKVEGILQSPDAKKELKVLDAYINKTGLVEKFKNSIVDSFRKILHSDKKEELLGKPPYDLEVDNFSNLKEEDLNRPEIKEKLVKAVLLQLNTSDISSLISNDLGDKGAERWIYDRSWNAAIGIPKGIAVGYGIYQVLCLGADHPMKSLGIATGIQALNQFVSGDSYYHFRKEMIGQ